VSGRPNILYFISHDTGRFLNCYGHEWIDSPNLDRLAADGVLFARNACNSPPCSPARGCIMTGRYAHTNGLIGLANQGWSLPEEEQTIVDYLNDAGYATYNCGGQHERSDARLNRYQHAPARRAWSNAEATVDDVIRLLKSGSQLERPFYINCFFTETHLPFDCDHYEPCDPDAVLVPGWLPDTPSVRRELARFHGSVQYLDRAIGRAVDALDDASLAEDTVVIYTTDHGAAFPRAKSMLYEPGVGVALMMRFPPGMARPGRYEPMVNHIDLTPTLLDMIGLDVPPAIQGRSYWPLLTGGPYEPNEHIFAERNFHDDYDPMRSVRSDRYRFIRNFQQKPAVSMPLDVQRSEASHELPANWYRPRHARELYDLQSDPDEQHNLAGSAEVADIESGLAARLQAWMEETDDPLLKLKGPTDRIPFPPQQLV